jgi:hypothetical protein
VTCEYCGFASMSARGSPAHDTKQKIKKVETIRTGML